MDTSATSFHGLIGMNTASVGGTLDRVLAGRGPLLNPVWSLVTLNMLHPDVLAAMSGGSFVEGSGMRIDQAGTTRTFSVRTGPGLRATTNAMSPGATPQIMIMRRGNTITGGAATQHRNDAGSAQIVGVDEMGSHVNTVMGGLCINRTEGIWFPRSSTGTNFLNYESGNEGGWAVRIPTGRGVRFNNGNLEANISQTLGNALQFDGLGLYVAQTPAPPGNSSGDVGAGLQFVENRYTFRPGDGLAFTTMNGSVPSQTSSVRVNTPEDSGLVVSTAGVRIGAPMTITPSGSINSGANANSVVGMTHGHRLERGQNNTVLRTTSNDVNWGPITWEMMDTTRFTSGHWSPTIRRVNADGTLGDIIKVFTNQGTFIRVGPSVFLSTSFQFERADFDLIPDLHNPGDCIGSPQYWFTITGLPEGFGSIGDSYGSPVLYNGDHGLLSEVLTKPRQGFQEFLNIPQVRSDNRICLLNDRVPGGNFQRVSWQDIKMMLGNAVNLRVTFSITYRTSN
jgi:hypothetical protein